MQVIVLYLLSHRIHHPQPPPGASSRCPWYTCLHHRMLPLASSSMGRPGVSMGLWPATSRCWISVRPVAHDHERDDGNLALIYPWDLGWYDDRARSRTWLTRIAHDRSNHSNMHGSRTTGMLRHPIAIELVLGIDLWHFATVGHGGGLVGWWFGSR